MSKLNDSFNNVFDKVNLSEEKANDLNKKIIVNYKKKKRNKKIVLYVIIISNILLVSTGITYANEIKGMVSSIFTKTYTSKTNEGEEIQKLKLMTNIEKELNYDANLSEPKCVSGIDEINNEPIKKECLSMYTYEELENELGIKLLKNDLFKHDKFIITKLEKKDGKIAKINLNMGNALMRDKNQSSNPSRVNYTIYIKTKYNESNNGELNHGNYTDETIPKYKINNLNTIAYGIEYGRRRVIYFDYDNVLYSFSMNPSIETRDNPDAEVQRILDEFHY